MGGEETSLVSVHLPSRDEEGPYRDMNGVNTVFFYALCSFQL